MAANSKYRRQSHMETMFALDFISLVLSKHAPRQAETSMSAFLKQVAPLGSLNSEVIHPPPTPESATKDVSAVSRGWRVQNFHAASNKLLNAASRLEGEIASETRYWSEVLAVKDKGWKICRLPRERQALGVQYGFLEGKRIHASLASEIGSFLTIMPQLLPFSAIAVWPLCGVPTMEV